MNKKINAAFCALTLVVPTFALADPPQLEVNVCGLSNLSLGGAAPYYTQLCLAALAMQQNLEQYQSASPKAASAFESTVQRIFPRTTQPEAAPAPPESVAPAAALPAASPAPPAVPSGAVNPYKDA